MARLLHYNSDPLWTSHPCVCAAGTFVPLGWKRLLLHSRTVGGCRISSRLKNPHLQKRPQFFLSSGRVWVFFPSAEEASIHSEWFVRRHFLFQPFSIFIPTLPPLFNHLLLPHVDDVRLRVFLVLLECVCVCERVLSGKLLNKSLELKVCSPFMTFKEPVKGHFWRCAELCEREKITTSTRARTSHKVNSGWDRNTFMFWKDLFWSVKSVRLNWMRISNHVFFLFFQFCISSSEYRIRA